MKAKRRGDLKTISAEIATVPSLLRNDNKKDFFSNLNLYVNGLYETHAFLWDEQNGMQDLGTFGGNSAKAYDINDSGQIVGQYRSPSGYSHAFLLTPTTVPEPSVMISYLLGLMWIVRNIIR